MIIFVMLKSVRWALRKLDLVAYLTSRFASNSSC
jgi:hypothetical protein